ncbi:hypothetical protein [Halomonas sp. LBP4]|uniref:hypothetical protein n=1 Tax=Halomonas sp. LBP4 TaxID=2044917 RepID=UPI000D764D5B|nr:hypothetical protein [Halomonas sp. LBP4]PXX98392.1 hypothetical protein CR157_08800 [Halomonas sp. LBP4]
MSISRLMARLCLLLLVLPFTAPLVAEELEHDTLQIVREVSLQEYEPPSDGKVTQDQIDEFIRIAQRAASLETRHMASSHASLLARIEAVALENGNWAEHQWVRSQLMQTVVTRTMANPSLDDASRHNDALFEANKDRLRAIMDVP